MLRGHALSFDMRMHIYHMTIRPVLTYAAPAWQYAAPTHIKELQIIQNREARIISGHSGNTRSPDSRRFELEIFG